MRESLKHKQYVESLKKEKIKNEEVKAETKIAENVKDEVKAQIIEEPKESAIAKIEKKVEEPKPLITTIPTVNIINPRSGIQQKPIKPKKVPESEETQKVEEPKAEDKSEPIETEKNEKSKETEKKIIELKTEPVVGARVKRPGVIDIKSIKGATQDIKQLDQDTREVIAKGLSNGIKLYLVELGVYDVNRGYNSFKIPHEIANFLKKTNFSKFNSKTMSENFGVNLDNEHKDMEELKMTSFKNLFDDIDDRYPKTQIVRTTEDILDKNKNRFTIFENMKRDELFKMNGVDAPKDDSDGNYDI